MSFCYRQTTKRATERKAIEILSEYLSVCVCAVKKNNNDKIYSILSIENKNSAYTPYISIVQDNP